jgi:hypothetical protein
MPIPFGCECGKRLQAKDEFAGKKMRCPGCGKLLVIPDTAPPPEDQGPVVRGPFVLGVHSADLATGPPSPPPAPPSPELVHFVCSCGRRLKARRQDAGADIDCPECGRTLKIPAADTETPPPPVVARPRPVGDGFLSQTATPWPDAQTRQRGADGPEPSDEKARSWVGTAVVLLLVVGVAAWWYFGRQIRAAADARQPKAAEVVQAARADFDELKIVPANALTLLTWRLVGPDVAEPRGQAAFAQHMPPGLTRLLNKRFGQVERVTVVSLLADPRFDPAAGQKGSEKDVWTIVRTVAPYERKAVFQALWSDAGIVHRTYKDRPYFLVYPQVFQVPMPMPKPGGPKGKRQILQAPRTPEDAFQVFQGPMPPMQPMRPKADFLKGPKGASQSRIPAVYFASPHVFVVGDHVSIRRLLEGKMPGTTGPQEEAVARARKGAALVIGLNQNQATLKGTPPPSAANVPPLTRAMQQSTAAVVAVDAAADAGHGKGSLKADLQFEFPNAKAALAVRQSVLGWKAQQAERNAEARARLEEKQTEEALAATLRTFGSVTPGQSAPLGGLNFAPLVPGMAMPKKEAEELARLKAEEGLVEGLADPSVTDKTMNLRLLLPPDSADLARQLWAPYAQFAVNALPSPRLPPGGASMKKPTLKKFP